MQVQVPSDFSSSRCKLDELFYNWLSLEDTHSLISSLVTDLHDGTLREPLGGAAANPAAFAAASGDGGAVAPLSPISKLLRSSREIGGDWSPSSHQPATPPRSPKSKSPRKEIVWSSLRLDKGTGLEASEALPEALASSPPTPDAAKAAEVVPQFFFPGLVPQTDESQKHILGVVAKLFGGQALGRDRLRELTVDVCGLPAIVNSSMFSLLARPSEASELAVREEDFVRFWKACVSGRSPAQRLLAALKRSADGHAAEPPLDETSFLVAADWELMMQELLATHPGLEFLAETVEFQSRYAETVIARIYYRLDRRNTGRITVRDIERSNLLDSLQLIECDDDINKELCYFSYEHFYVLYCKFWELDADHDLEINRDELLRYGSHALTRRMVDRLFTQEPRRFSCGTPNRMGYQDFIWFSLSEEDKTTDTSIEFWFRAIDLDSDGLITVFEMEHFYREQLYRMHCLAVEAVSFVDLMCQLNDMVKPEKEGVFTLRDIKKRTIRPMVPHFFNALFNLNKFVAHEHRDQHTIRQERLTPHFNDWDRFAQIEYIRLAAEEEDDEAAHDDYNELAYDTRQGIQGIAESPF